MKENDLKVIALVIFKMVPDFPATQYGIVRITAIHFSDIQ